MPLYPVLRQLPAPPAANEAHAVPAPALLADAAGREPTNAALNDLARAINDLREALIALQQLR